MNNRTAHEIIKRVGLVRYKVAVSCGIHPTIFSDWLHDRREISREQLQRVEFYLQKFQNVTAETT